MAPIKFEENIKEKLENRTINPSANAWETLSKNLENTPQTKSKNKFWWLAIAASFIGMLLVYNIMFNNTSQTIPSQNVVEIDTDYINEINKNNTIDKAIKVNTSTAEITTQNQAVIETKNQNIKNQNQVSTKQKVNGKNNLNTNKTYAALVNKTSQNNKATTASTLVDSSVKANKIIKNLEAVAQSQTTEKPVIFDDEIEQLLKAAQQKVSKTSTNTTIALDHNSILNEVEDDLERSFRDKFLLVVKDGLHTAKDVMADRMTNNQDQ